MKIITSLSGLFAAVLAGTLSVANAQTFLTNGLVAYYPFNGNANDESGNGNDGIVNGATPGTNRFGISSNSYVFKATGDYPSWTGDYVSTSSINGLPVSTNDFSVSVWLNISSNSPDYQIIFCNREVNQFQLAIVPLTGPTQLGAANGELWFHTGHDISNGGPPQCRAAVQWILNQWYEVVLVRSSNTVTMYRDGAIVGQRFTTLGNGAFAADRILDFGYRSSPANHPLWGQLDDIRIYNRALSLTEVQELYAYECGPRINLLKAVKPSFSGLYVGTNYQLQVSGDLNTWTNEGSPFIATNSGMIYPQYWDVENWGQLFFRLQVAP